MLAENATGSLYGAHASRHAQITPMLQRHRIVAGQPVVLYATSPTGPCVSRPADLSAWRERIEMGCRGEASCSVEGKPLDSAERGRRRAEWSRRATAQHQRARRVLG